MPGFSVARDAFTDAFAGLTAAVYDYAPPIVPGPSIFVFPDDPYVEFHSINVGRLTLRFLLTAAVPMNDNQGSLVNLEDLVIGIITNLPAGTVIQSVGAPAVTQVGPSSLLVSEMAVQVTTTLGD